MLLINLDWREC